jgi:hypothetical protein
MRVKTSLDWDRVSISLISQMHAAPASARRDLAKMLGHITDLVKELSLEEIELRRYQKFSSPRSERLLAEINNLINEFEKWLMFAQLSLG